MSDPARSQPTSVRTAVALASHKAVIVLVSLVLLLAVALDNAPDGSGVLLPLSGGHVLPSMCLMQRTFHVPCPGCGLTRSFVAMAAGDLADAIRFHALGPVIFLLLAAQLPYRGYLIATRRPEPPAPLARAARAVCPIMVAALLANWVITLVRL